MSEQRGECEDAVLAAAREERAARAALTDGNAPDPEWSEEDERAYQERLERWRAASRALVEALQRFGSSRNTA